MRGILSHGSLFQATMLAGLDVLTHSFALCLQKAQATMERRYYSILQDSDFSFHFKFFSGVLLLVEAKKNSKIIQIRRNDNNDFSPPKVE
jgi:hypothetical protein